MKIPFYILNWVFIKTVPLTHFKLWTGRKSNLNYFKVWRCPPEVRLYNSTLSKLDFIITWYYFISYPNHFKGYQFYNPNKCTKNVKSQIMKFLEFDVVKESSYSKTIEDNSSVGRAISFSLYIQTIVEPPTPQTKPVEVQNLIVEATLDKIP